MTSLVLENKRLNPKLIRRRSVLLTWPGVDPPEAEDEIILSTGLKEDSEITRSEESRSIILHAEKIPLKEVSPDALRLDISIPDGEKMMMEQENATLYNALNAPMLITWLNMHYDELSTVLRGLEFILYHAQKGEGCVILLKYGVLHVLLKIQRHEAYSDDKNVQLLCAQIFKQLLECNYTRSPLILTSDVLKITFSIGHRFMSSVEHVKASVHCILQCARSEINREEIINSNLIGYCSNFCKAHSAESLVLGPVLRTFSWVGNTDHRLEEVCRLSGLQTTLQGMKRHLNNAKLLKPALRFLTRACAFPWGMQLILKKQAVPMIIFALRALFDEAELQLEGLKMLQAMGKTEEGYRQISETKGGWQSICQGTVLGNALLHDLKTDFHNPGWCIGDSPVLTILNERKQATLQMSRNTLPGTAKTLWTSRGLMEFQGLNMTGKTLPEVVLRNDVYFELIKSLDLLPRAQDKNEWFLRLAVFERENKILIEDMVLAVLEMKRKSLQKKNEIQTSENDSFKPVFVNGVLVDMEMLAANDVLAQNVFYESGEINV